MRGLQLLGADPTQAMASMNPYAAILQAAGALAESGISTYQKGEAEKKTSWEREEAGRKSAADAEAALATAVAADRRAVEARAAASAAREEAAAAKGPAKAAAEARAAAEEAAAGAAEAAQDRAGARVPLDVVDRRVEAVEKSLDEATARLRVTNDARNRALVEAWTKAYNKAANRQVVARGAPGADAASPSRGSWWVRPVVGPVPGWGVVAGGAGLLAIIVAVLVKMLGGHR